MFLKSLKNQLLASFFIFPALLVVIAIINQQLINSVKKVWETGEEINIIANKIEYLINQELFFLDIEEENEEFHKNKTLPLLKEHDSLFLSIQADLTHLKSHKVESDILKEILFTFDQHIYDHYTIFRNLAAMTLERGFKDYGLEGEMRNYIHTIENSPRINREKILSLRRSEKDFLLRADTLYSVQLNHLINELVNELEKDRLKNNPEISVLMRYQDTFNQLAEKIFEIGSYNSGYKKQLNESIQHLNGHIHRYHGQIQDLQENTYTKIYFIYSGSFLLFLVLAIILSYFLAKYRSTPFIKLSHAIENMIEKKKDKFKIDINLDNASEEFKILIEGFNELLNKIRLQLRENQEKSIDLKKQNKELRKLNNELDRFVYSVSHDLRAPLASLLGLINLTKLEDDISRIREYARLQEESVKKLDQFIHDIINISRNTRQQLVIDHINIHQVVEEVISNNRFNENFDKIIITTTLLEEFPFYTDSRRLTIILNNLISNAIKYYDPIKILHEVKIFVETKKDKAIIKIWDNGQGIGIEHIEKIFNMFYRANYQSKGSGLGLYIVQETVAKMEGQVTVLSKENEYTEFMVTLPNYLEQVKVKMNKIDNTFKEYNEPNPAALLNNS